MQHYTLAIYCVGIILGFPNFLPLFAEVILFERQIFFDHETRIKYIIHNRQLKFAIGFQSWIYSFINYLSLNFFIIIFSTWASIHWVVFFHERWCLLFAPILILHEWLQNLHYLKISSYSNTCLWTSMHRHRRHESHRTCKHGMLYDCVLKEKPVWSTILLSRPSLCKSAFYLATAFQYAIQISVDCNWKVKKFILLPALLLQKPSAHSKRSPHFFRYWMDGAQGCLLHSAIMW